MENQTAHIETLTVEEVSDILKVDPRTIYRRVDENTIPHFRVGETGAIRFVKTKFLQWIEEQHKS